MNEEETRNVGQIVSTYRVKNQKGEIENRRFFGTGSIYHRVTDTKFIIITCAHNFVRFDDIPTGENHIEVEPFDADFYLGKTNYKE